MQIMDAHWITVLIISFTFLFTVLYWFYVLPFKQAKIASLITVITGAFAITAVLFNVVAKAGPLGPLIILAMWIWPATLVWLNRKELTELDQRKLVGLQILRVIGGLFILEMLRGHIPGSFSLPAGLGDILVGVIAAYLVLKFKTIPRWGVITVLVLGLADFALALTSGVLSSPGPLQIFAKGFDNQINLFPTGLIPFFLVPYAISFHILSWINLRN